MILIGFQKHGAEGAPSGSGPSVVEPSPSPIPNDAPPVEGGDEGKGGEDGLVGLFF